MNNWGVPDRNDAAADAAIREVLVGYCRCADTFDDDGLLQLFTADAEWLRPGKDPLRGHEEIRAFLQARDRKTIGRHIVTNIIVEVEGPQRASTICYYMVLKASVSGGSGAGLVPTVMGEYHDAFRLQDERWRIARRDGHHVLRAAS